MAQPLLILLCLLSIAAFLVLLTRVAASVAASLGSPLLCPPIARVSSCLRVIERRVVGSKARKPRALQPRVSLLQCAGADAACLATTRRPFLHA